jgi:hypothetical protein
MNTSLYSFESKGYIYCVLPQIGERKLKARCKTPSRFAFFHGLRPFQSVLRTGKKNPASPCLPKED